MTLLIKNARLDGRQTDVLMENGLITRIAPDIQCDGAEVVDATGMAILPPFYNCHCHAAMTLLRGYADDMPLAEWLNDYIWPREASLTPEDIYWGSKLAILEMIKSGTVFFVDMYFVEEQVERAVMEMGIRACLGDTFMSHQGEKEHDRLLQRLSSWKPASSRIQKSIAPHAIYTCDTALLERCADVVNNSDDVFCQIHVSETEDEVANCKKEHDGMTPVEYLNKVGILGEKTVAAHVVHVSEDDADILSATKTVSVHNPCSNMKLSSGVMNVPMLKAHGCRLALGTDGASSNNNLDMMDEMKAAALLAKLSYGPDKLSAAETFRMATECGAAAFGLNAGKIEEGRLADAMLVRLDNHRMVPDYNIISNLVYSASSEVIDTLICDGRVVMRNRKVEGEEEILANVAERCRK